MQKYFENLGDFIDGTCQQEIDRVDCLLNGIFVTIGSSMLAYTCLLIISAIWQW